MTNCVNIWYEENRKINRNLNSKIKLKSPVLAIWIQFCELWCYFQFSVFLISNFNSLLEEIWQNHLIHKNTLVFKWKLPPNYDVTRQCMFLLSNLFPSNFQFQEKIMKNTTKSALQALSDENYKKSSAKSQFTPIFADFSQKFMDTIRNRLIMHFQALQAQTIKNWWTY